MRIPTCAALALIAVVGLSCTSKDGSVAPETPAPAVATTIQVSQPTLQFVSLGDSTAITAIVRDQRNVTMTGQSIAWTASPVGIVTASGAGWVKAIATGTATVSASAGSLIATVAVTVTQVPASLRLERARLAFSAVAAKDSARATVRDARGNTIPGALVTWSSSMPSVATVSASGAVSAVGAGSTVVTATHGSLTAVLGVTVNIWGVNVPQVIASVDGALMNFPDGWVRQFALTDFDQDGNDDVVFNAWAACAVAGCGTGAVRNPRGKMLLLQRSSSGGITDITSSRFPSVPQVWVNSAVVADFNKDGFPDLVLPGFTDIPPVAAPSEVYMSSGAGYTLSSDPTTIWAHGAIAVDADRDGCTDVLVGVHEQPFWKGNCAGGFSKMQFTDPQIVPMQGVSHDLHRAGQGNGICTGDFNRDGSTDIVYTDALVALRIPGWNPYPADNVVVEVNWNLPRPAITRVRGLQLPYFDRESVVLQQKSHDMRCEVADFDRDGDDDIFISSTPWDTGAGWGGSAWQVYLNDGNFAFRDVSATAFPGRTTNMAFGFNPLLRDLNGDGITDILFSGMSNDASQTYNPAWLGNGDGTFRPSAAVDFNALRQQAKNLLDAHLNSPAWARGHGIWAEAIPLRRATGEYDFILPGMETSFVPEPGSTFGRPTVYLVFMPVGVRF